MFNFSMYELQDNEGGEFGKTDDHIVPHPGDEHKEQFPIPGDSCKNSIHGLRGIKRCTDYVSSYGTKGEEELYVPYLNQKEIMMENSTWSHKPEGSFSSGDGDLHKELESLTSENTRMSDYCFKSNNVDSSGSELCLDDNIMRDKCVVEDNSVSQYSINNISHTDNDLSFLDNDLWLDIGNFEDVDRALSCDLTFGIGSLSNDEEEFCWLSSSHGTEGSDDALKSGFKFSSAEVSPLKSVSNYDVDLKENIEGPPINDCNKKTSPVEKQPRSQMDVDHDAVPTPSSTFDDTNMKSSNADDLMPKEKIQGKLSKPSSGKRKKGYLENGDSVHCHAHVEQYEALKQPFETSSSGVTSQDSMHKHRPNVDSDSSGCTKIQTPLMHPDYGHTPNYTSLLPTMSGSRPKLNGHASPFKESLYASNMEDSHDNLLEAAAFKGNDKRDILYNCHDTHILSGGFKNENISRPVQFQSPGSAQLVGHQFQNENEGHSEVEGVSIGFSQEIDSSNVQERSSSRSSALDEISLEATSFRQLQQVMEKLDIRTKLCLRDSLYRLARSAEQRHNDANAMGQIGDNAETCKTIMTQGENRCTGFMDIENNTNPIDRSIAHLLFHRPSDPSVLPLNDTVPFKSSSMVHGSVINPHVMTEKRVCEEESSAGVEKSLRVAFLIRVIVPHPQLDSGAVRLIW